MCYDRNVSPRDRDEVDQPLRALFWMAGSAVAMSGMGAVVKRLAPELPELELVFFRSLLNVLVLIPLIRRAGQEFFPRDRKLLAFRGVVGFGAVSCMFYGVAHLPIAIAMMLYWSAPIFVILISRVLLGEKLSGRSVFWIAVAFVGLALVLRPDRAGHDGGLSWFWIGVGGLGAVFGGMAYVAVRAATARVGVNVIVFYFVAVSTLLSSVPALLAFKTPTPTHWGWLALLALCGSAGQWMMTQGYRFAAAGIASTMSLLNIAFSALFGWWFFGETLDASQGLGLLVLGVAIVLMTVFSLSD